MRSVTPRKIFKYPLVLALLALACSAPGSLPQRLLDDASTPSTRPGELRVAGLSKDFAQNFRDFQERMDSYPLLVVDRAFEIDAEPLAANEKKQSEMLGQIGYLLFLIEARQFAKAEALLDDLPLERSAWPGSLALLEARIQALQNRPDRARKICQEYIKKNSRDVNAYLFLGDLERRVGDKEAAAKALEIARKIAPRNRKALEGLSVYYRAQLLDSMNARKPSPEIMKKLEEVYEQLVEVMPGRQSIPYLGLLVKFKSSANKIREAHDFMEKLVRLDPRPVRQRLDFVRLQITLGLTDDAIETLKKGVVLDPNTPELLKNVRAVLTPRGADPLAKSSTERVLKFFRSISQEYPGRDDIQLRYAQELLGARKFDEATQVLEASLALDPHNKDGWFFLVDLYMSQKKPNLARETIDRYVASAPDDPEVLADAVRVLLSAGLTKPAQEYLARLRKAQPDSAEGRSLELQIYLALGEDEKALTHLRRNIREKPGNIIDYVQLGRLLTKLGRGEETIEPLREALRHVDGESRSVVERLLAGFLSEAGRADEAIETLKVSLARRSDNKDSWFLLIDLYTEQKKPKETRKAVEQYVKRASGTPEALAYAVQAFLRAEMIDDAQKYLATLRQTSPDFRENRSLELLVLLALKQNDKALSHLQANIKRNPSNIIDYVQLWRLLADMDRTAEAIEPLRRALLHVEGDNRKIVERMLVSLLTEVGRSREALPMAARLVQEAPQDWSLRLLLADIHMDMGEEEKGNALLDQVARDHGDLAEAQYRIGLARWDQERLVEAETAFSRAIKIDPKHAEAYNSLGYLLCERNLRLDEAMAFVRKAMALKPGEYHILDSLGWIQFKKGEFAQAIKTLEKAIEIGDKDAVILEHLGRSYLEAGRESEALDQFKAALKLIPKSKLTKKKEEEKTLELRRRIKALEP